MTRIAVFALALTLACAGAVVAQSPRAQSTSDHFRIESDTVQGKSGRSLVQGYVYNLYGRPALTVQLLVEGLDASGRTVSTKVLYVSGGVPAGGRGWFETAAPGPAATFRVSLFSWAWSR